MRSIARYSIPLLLLMLAACKTVGLGREEGGYAEVAPTIAHEMILDNRQIVVLDIRSAEDYDRGHIAGALSTPLDSIETRLPELFPYQSSTVLVYGDDQVESKRGARLLVAAGFKNIVHIRGGITSWIEKGYKAVTSQ